MSLRIVHCSNFNCVRLKGCYLASMGYKLNNGLTRLGHQVITYSDRDMSRLFGVLGNKIFISNKKNNENFYKFCLNVKPDVLFLGHADTISAETIQRIRGKLPNLRALQWNVDPIDEEADTGKHNIKNIQSKLDVVDCTLITTGEKRLYAPFNPDKNMIGFIPNPVDASIEKNRVFEIENTQYDLFYASSADAPRSIGDCRCTVKEVTDYITSQCQDAKVMFPGVSSPFVNGTEYLEMLGRSAMVLNLSRVNNKWYSSDRMAHAMGNGCLTFIDRNTKFDDLFSEDDAVFYSEKEEITDKINYFIKNPKERMKIAKNGWEKSYHLFNETKIAQYCLDMLSSTADCNKYEFYVEQGN